MSVTAALHRTEHDQGSAETMRERILFLASQGLKLRDISSLLHIHPEIVRRTLQSAAESATRCAFESCNALHGYTSLGSSTWA